MGFRRHRNTSHAVLSLINAIHNNQTVDPEETTNKKDRKTRGRFTSAIFVDVRKAFDCLKHEIITDKMYYYGFSECTVSFFKSYLSGRTMCVRVNGVTSSNRQLTTGVPQGSILGPLLYILGTNDGGFFLGYPIFYADDTTCVQSGSSAESLAAEIKDHLSKLEAWFSANGLALHPNKTRYIVFPPYHLKGCKKLESFFNLCSFKLNGQIIQRVGFSCEEKSVRFLGVWIDEHLNFQDHIEKVKAKLAFCTFALNRSKHLLSHKAKRNIYQAFMRSILDFSVIFFGAKTESVIKPLQVMQNNAIRAISKGRPVQHLQNMYKDADVLKVRDLFELNAAKLAYQVTTTPKLLPECIKDIFKSKSLGPYELRTPVNDLAVKRVRYVEHQRNVIFHLPQIWNRVDPAIRALPSLRLFASAIRMSLLQKNTPNTCRSPCSKCGSDAAYFNEKWLRELQQILDDIKRCKKQIDCGRSREFWLRGRLWTTESYLKHLQENEELAKIMVANRVPQVYRKHDIPSYFCTITLA